MSRQPPPWFNRAYGRHPPGAWEESRQQCRDILIRWARRRQPGTYKDVSQAVNTITWPDGEAFRGQIGWLLGQVSVAEWLDGRPLLSAMVVNSDTGRPGSGFFDLCRDNLGISVGRSEEEEIAFWDQEVDRCHEYWRNRLSG